MSYNTAQLKELASKLGIQLSFIDRSVNKEYVADKKSLQTICRSLGYPADTDVQVQKSLKKFEKERFSQFAPFVRVIQEWEQNPFVIELNLTSEQSGLPVSWILTREDGTTQSGMLNPQDMPILEEFSGENGTIQKRRVSFPISAPLGYHHLSFLCDGKEVGSNMHTRLIVTPMTCYMPEILQKGHRVFGFPIQLYAIKSRHNWGMGDFSDLKEMADIASGFGASLVGINPINALFADTPQDASPYFATSRIFFNPLYIDTDSVPEAGELPTYQAYKETPEFIEAVTKTRGSDIVEYETLAPIKYKAMRILFDAFKTAHFNKEGAPVTARGQAFATFVNEADPFLTNFATFQVLRKVFLKQGKSALWWRWEKGYTGPHDTKIPAFQKKYADEIQFIQYQQFLAFEQYEAVKDKYNSTDMPIGLYTDLPVGVGENSAEVWSNQEVFMQLVTTGAPPDSFNKKGQDWSLAPFNPYALKKMGYEPFIRVIRSAMRSAGAVRIDHAFGLMRLYLRVKEASGAYLSYPFKDLMGIIALESHRFRCLVIAEDLGTAPDGFHEEMLKVSALSFKIFHFERNYDGFIMPDHYEHRCLIASGTHDLPTYTALWKGLDLELGKKYKTLSLTQYREHKKARETERQQFIEAFKRVGLPMPSDEELSHISPQTVPDWFIPNTYAFLGKTNSMLLLVRMEDILEQDQQVNLPGTYLEYPNWRYKLPIILEGLSTDPRMIRICEIIRKERPVVHKEM